VKQRSEVVIPIRATRDQWPRDSQGDPNFRDLDHLKWMFSQEQIVAMCNRYLRQQEYQTFASKEYETRKREARRAAKHPKLGADE
jgi:hypothetical protein